MPAAGRRGDWSWYQLDPVWAERVVAAAAIRPGDLVVEFGAGTGSLTEHLVGAGARVLAVELHPGRAAALRHRFAGDAVQVLPIDLADFRVPRRPFRVVANPPYRHGRRLVRALTARSSGLRSAHLVLRRDTARSLAETIPARHFAADLGLTVPRAAFRPRPQVDSVLLSVRRR